MTTEIYSNKDYILNDWIMAQRALSTPLDEEIEKKASLHQNGNNTNLGDEPKLFSPTQAKPCMCDRETSEQLLPTGRTISPGGRQTSWEKIRDYCEGKIKITATHMESVMLSLGWEKKCVPQVCVCLCMYECSYACGCAYVFVTCVHVSTF